MTRLETLRNDNRAEMTVWQAIPATGGAVQEILAMEKAFSGEPRVEAYREVAECTSSCKVCKSLSCSETGFD